MSVVGTLTVDLVANTAQFTGDLGKAANNVKGFAAEAEKAGERADYSMTEARHGVMLLGEEFGVHLPRGITSFLASIGPVGAAMEAAFPFLAIAVGATLIIEHLTAMREAQEKLVEAQVNFGTSSQTVFNNLDNKILETGIRVDELNHNHMAALSKQLELIDRQSLADLSHQFETVSKSADLAFAQMKASWYQIDGGSEGAAHALEQFKADYAALLAQGKGEEAHGLLSGTLKQAELSLSNMKAHGEIFMSYHQKEADAQETLIGALNAQLNVEQKILDLKNMQGAAAAQSTGNSMGADADKMARAQAEQAKQAAEAEQQIWEQRYKDAVTQLQQNEREKIEATQKGSQERLAAINSAIKEEQSKGLQDSAFYRQLLNDRVNVAREMGEQELKLQQDLAAEQLKQTLAMAKLKEEAQVQADKHALIMHQTTAKEATNAEIKAAQDEEKIETAALDRQISDLQKFGDKYLVEIQKLENKKRQIIQQSENQITKIRNGAEEKQYQDMRKAMERMDEVISRSVAHSLIEGKNMAQGLEDTGKQMLEAATANITKTILLGDMKQAKDAAHAAASAFTWVMQDMPFPVNAVLAPIAGAAAFAGVMAFEHGGMVPGTGPQPAIVHGGETVVTRKLTELVKASDGKGDKPIVNHFHITTPNAKSMNHSANQVAAKVAHAQYKVYKRNH